MDRKKKKSSTKKKKPQPNSKAENRTMYNDFHRSVESKVNDVQVASSDATTLLQQLEIPRPILEANVIFQQLVSLSGTNVQQNTNDPFGDGDQSGCGQLGMQGEQTRQILRSLFSQGGDLDSYLCYNGFTEFGYACAIGDASTVLRMLRQTEFGSKERMKLLEFRETGMRLAPICLTVALYKSREHVSMRLRIPVSHMDHFQVFKILLKYGAKPDSKELTGKTVIHYAAGMMAQPITLEMADLCIDASKSSSYFGKDIVLRNLSNEAYNGTKGTLGGYVSDSAGVGRREVMLENGKSLSIRPQNIYYIEKEKCIFDDTRNLVNDQDRVGMISLHEVFMSQRVDVAKFLTEKHNASVDLKDRGGTSVREMSYTCGYLVSDMANLIREQGTKQTKQQKESCYNCGASEGDKICSRCKKACYCSVSCQREHWKEHKNSCKPMSIKLRKPPNLEHQLKIAQTGRNGVFHGGTYQNPDGININDTFWIKVQLSINGIEGAPHLLYDKTRSCTFYLNHGEPGHGELLEKVKQEKNYLGQKAYFKASFGNDGNCTIYLHQTGLKNW